MALSGLTLLDLFRTAAERALFVWQRGQWDRQREDADDLTNDLWVWYAQRPSTQKMFADMQPWEIQKAAHRAAMQILAEQALEMDKFKGKSLYSSEAVRAALSGESNNKYLVSILPYALARLDARNANQREAIRRRYDDGVVPERGSSEEALLKRAVKSVSNEVNVIYLTADNDGVANRTTNPESRRRQGRISDPTGDLAIALIEHPEVRDAFMEESPLEQWVGPALPTYQVTEKLLVRPDGHTARLLSEYPQMVEPYIKQMQERLV